METVLTSTSGQKILVMWDVLVMNVMRHSLMFFFKENNYSIMMMPTFSGLTVAEGQKEEIRVVNGGGSQVQLS